MKDVKHVKEGPEGRIRERLEEAEQALEAIRTGEVDALVVHGPRGPQVYSLEGPDRPFRLFVEHMQQGALTLGADDVILYANGFFADLIKAPLETVIGDRMPRFLCSGSESVYRELVGGCTTAPTSGAIHLSASDGDRILTHFTVTRIGGTEAPNCCIVVSDLRGQEQAHQAQFAREAAEAANSAKDQFLAILSHELRAPLNSILGWAQILERKELDPEARKGIESIARNARAQAQLISDLLDTSRIATGKLRLDLRTVRVDEVVEAAVYSIVPTAEDRSIRVETALQAGEATVIGDPARLQQIVWNLLTNAVKYTPRGGGIRVATRRRASSIEIEVSDNGQGMSPEFVPKLFGLFQQAETATTRRAGGLGLGLAIVKQLSELHGGSVRAESEGEGKGSTFTVRLPAHKASATAIGRRDPATASDEPDLRGRRVRGVDDDADARELFERAFAECGAEVLAAASVSEAVPLVKERHPHVLVSDIAMPERDGYDLIREVRALGIGEDELPAVAVSAFAHPEDRSRALTAGYQEHLSKPVSAKELSSRVAELLEGR